MVTAAGRAEQGTKRNAQVIINEGGEAQRTWISLRPASLSLDVDHMTVKASSKDSETSASGAVADHIKLTMCANSLAIRCATECTRFLMHSTSVTSSSGREAWKAL